MSFTCYRTKSKSSTSSSENDDDSSSKISTFDEHINIVDIKEEKMLNRSTYQIIQLHKMKIVREMIVVLIVVSPWIENQKE
jgi:hypothetical protein